MSDVPLHIPFDKNFLNASNIHNSFFVFKEK